MHNGVHIRVEGLVLEKLLDRAVESGISFLSIEGRSPHDMELWLDDRNARRFLALAERFSYRAVVLERRGSSAVRVRMRARWSVLVGLCVAVLMLWAFSTRIWRIDIEVEESRHAPIASIETALQELGIVPGVAKEAIDADTLEAQLYERTGGFSFIGVKVQGVRLLVTAAGEIPAPDTFDLEADRDLVAAHDGIVVSVNAMAGTARVKPGDCVTAGQVLIAGEERLSAEETGGVCALGEVVARTWSEGTAQAELYVEKRTYTGRSSAASALELFGWSIPLSQGATFAQMEETVLSLPIVGMFLPLRVLRAERMEYTVSRERADLQNLKEEIAQIAWENAISGLPEGCVIVDKWIEYSMIGEDGIEARAVVEAQSNIAITREALAAGMAD